LAHIRFRMAIKAQAANGQLRLEDLPYHALLGITGSWIGFILCILCIAATIYTACGPPFEFLGFLEATLALPCVVVCYVGWKLWKRPAYIRLSEADLISGRREMDLTAEKEKELAERQTWGPIKRFGSTSNFLSDFQDVAILLLGGSISKGGFFLLYTAYNLFVSIIILH
jgi:yeast amino acid transporter